MRRRLRAGAFLVLALLAAALAATLASGYGARLADAYGELRPVLVAARDLPRGRELAAAGPAALTVRRVPARFVPTGALSAPSQALGLAPRVALPRGSYLTAPLLRPPGARPAAQRLARGRRAVEIAVSGAEALLADTATGRRQRVDVVVTTEPLAAGRGRTYVAVAAAPLLSLRPLGDGEGPEASAAATLALGRRQALRLIAAQSFARRLTLLPAAP